MVDTEGFKKWLKENSSYSEAVIGDMASRVKRADGIIEWYDEEVYQFYLEQKEQYKCLSVSVRSQIKRVSNYIENFMRGDDKKRLRHLRLKRCATAPFVLPDFLHSRSFVL